MKSTSKAGFAGRLVMLGFGSIGQATLPLLAREFGLTGKRVTIVTRSPDETGIAAEFGVTFIAEALNEGNYRTVLSPLLSAGDFLLNLSVDVASPALVRLCREQGALYLDTCIEPWPGRYENPDVPMAQRTNYALREEMLRFRLDQLGGPTAVVTMGANPGVASLLVKQALMNMAGDQGIDCEPGKNYEDWARLAQKLGIKAIHIAERDSQLAETRRKLPGEFVNTWSVDGFVAEALQPAELGWGTHEKHWPPDARRHGYGSDAAIYLTRPGAATRVLSWTPLAGSYVGFLVTHAESISIADHLTLRENGELVYRPTVHYAYHPCDDAVLSLHEAEGNHWQLQKKQRIMRDEISEGRDELGVLLMGNVKGCYWYGSRMSIEEARRLAPHNSATSLQVVAGILGGMAWAMKNPKAGVVEPDDIDYREALSVALPYLGEMAGAYGEWNPVKERCKLFDEGLDEGDPWQFRNIRLS